LPLLREPFDGLSHCRLVIEEFFVGVLLILVISILLLHILSEEVIRWRYSIFPKEVVVYAQHLAIPISEAVEVQGLLCVAPNYLELIEGSCALLDDTLDTIQRCGLFEGHELLTPARCGEDPAQVLLIWLRRLL